MSYLNIFLHNKFLLIWITRNLDICLQVDPTNNDVMNDVLSKEKSMDSLNIHIEIRKKE